MNFESNANDPNNATIKAVGNDSRHEYAQFARIGSSVLRGVDAIRMWPK